MPTEQDIRKFTATVEDAVTYPILTRETSNYSSDGSSRGASTSSTGGGLGKTAQQTIREVLGWRSRPNDPKGFLAALNKAFTLKEVEGHTEWDWKPQSFMLQADLGEITGAQASIHKQATVVLENALPLLDGLTALRTDADIEDYEAMRSIIRTELKELVNELALTGGPRVQRIDSFFEKLLGPQPISPDPELVGGQLRRLRDRLGLSRRRVNTIVEEQTFTNFLILVDYVNSLYQSWTSKRRYFTRNSSAEPFLGTQLVLISQTMDVILEQAHEVYEAMDSVLFGPAERQATLLNLPGEAPITVAELLDWVENFAQVEGRELIQEGGKDGVVIFRSTAERLQRLVQKASDLSGQPASNPARAYHSQRVYSALSELAQYLTAAVDRSSEISRRPLLIDEEIGEEENLPLGDPPDGALPRPNARIWKVEPAERRRLGDEPAGNGPWSPAGGSTAVHPGEEVKVALYGQNLHDLSLDFGPGVEVRDVLYDSKGRKAIAALVINENAKGGARYLRSRDCHKETQTILDALTIEVIREHASKTLAHPEFQPACGLPGQSKRILFKGKIPSGAAVCFGEGIRVKRTCYCDGGDMEADIEIGATARSGGRKISIYTPDHGSVVLEKEFNVECASASQPAEFTIAPYKVTATSCETNVLPVSEQANPAAVAGRVIPEDIQAALKQQGITQLRGYTRHDWDKPCELKKKEPGTVPVQLEKGKRVKCAYLRHKENKQLIPHTKLDHKADQVSLSFETSGADLGPYELIKVYEDDTIGHVPTAVNLSK